MSFTAKDVATLRAKTGCGMMDCKKALTDANGDMEKAAELLREKGLAASVKKASRIAAEGVAFAKVCDCGKVGVVIDQRRDGLRREERELHRVCRDLRGYRDRREPGRR